MGSERRGFSVGLKLLNPPAEDPVTVAEATKWARITDTTENSLITSLIKAATANAEQITGRVFVTQTWTLSLDEFADEIQLLQPLASVSSITYIDTNGANQTLSNSVYVADTVEGKVYPAYNQTWPSVRAIPNAITITFVSGYGAATAVPESIKSWIRIRVATLYEHREAIAEGKPLPRDFVDGLLDPYKVY